MNRLTEKCWRNLDPWETCGQDNHCTRGCHEEGGCIKGCKVQKNYSKLAKYEDTLLEPEEVKEMILDICKGDFIKWKDKLTQILHDNYENSK